MIDALLKAVNGLTVRAYRHRQQRVIARANRVVVRAFYDAAKTTSENEKHWRGVGTIDANAANSPSVRRTLRNRTRYERANNAFLAGMIASLGYEEIGCGPRLQLTEGTTEQKRIVEQAFTAWMREVRLGAKLRLLREARGTDGEGFALLTTNKRLRSPVSLDLRLIEADMVATPQFNMDPDRVDGIELDGFGNPANYHVLKNHPGAMGGAYAMDYETIPASDVIHWFRLDRPGQYRGVPEFTPALWLFAQLRRFTLSVAAAAELAADLAAVLESDLSAFNDVGDKEAGAVALEEGEDDDEIASGEPGKPFDLIDIERRGMLTLPAGMKLNQFKAEQPQTQYPDFVRALLREIARCVQMPVRIALGDSSDFNYASGRLDDLPFQRFIRVERDDAECVVLDHVFSKWLEAGVLVSDLIPVTYRNIIGRTGTIPHKWHWPGFQTADPLKAASARAVDLKSGVRSHIDICNEDGRDIEEHLDNLKRVKDLSAERGITIGDSGGTGTAGGTDSGNAGSSTPADAALVASIVATVIESLNEDRKEAA